MNFRGSGSVTLNQDFLIKLLDSTIILGLFETNISAPKQRTAILETFEKLADVPYMKGPKFVFAHILLPHRPYRFDSNGELLTAALRRQRTSDENYINQLKFTNTKIMWLVSEILEKSSNPPVIIIQSDEGPRARDVSFEKLIPKHKKMQRDMIEITLRFNIINAYYLPGVDSTVLYPNITPVNSFRIIFNQYFGTDFELLEDKSYISKASKKKLYGFTEIQPR